MKQGTGKGKKEKMFLSCFVFRQSILQSLTLWNGIGQSDD
jgi:hypothetical protein